MKKLIDWLVLYDDSAAANLAFMFALVVGSAAIAFFLVAICRAVFHN